MIQNLILGMKVIPKEKTAWFQGIDKIRGANSIETGQSEMNSGERVIT